MSATTEEYEETQVGDPIPFEGYLIRLLERSNPIHGGRHIHGYRAEWKRDEANAEVEGSVYTATADGDAESAVEWAKEEIRHSIERNARN